jgi:hypothetical protein
MLRWLLATILVAFLTGCASSPAPATPTPAASSAAPSQAPASASTSPSQTAFVAPTTLTFEHVFAFDRAEIVTITAAPDGYLAGGCQLDANGDCQAALVLRSADGQAWDPVTLPDAVGKRVVEVDSTPFGLVALGLTVTSEPPAFRAAWRSSAGTLWEPLSMDAPATVVFETLAQAPDRVVFFGADYTNDFVIQDIALGTTDGASWTSGTSPALPKIAAGPGFVAVGDPCVDMCTEDPRTQAYRSADGLDWTQDAIPDAMTATTVSTMAAFGGGAIVGGMTSLGGPSRAVLWLDASGSWEPVPLEGGAGISVEAVVATADGLAVVGAGGGEGHQGCWTPDGRTYTRLPVVGLGDVFIAGSASGAETLLLTDYRDLYRLTH